MPPEGVIPPEPPRGPVVGPPGERPRFVIERHQQEFVGEIELLVQKLPHAPRASVIRRPNMLSLASSAMATLTGTRSLLKCGALAVAVLENLEALSRQARDEAPIGVPHRHRHAGQSRWRI